MNRFILWPGVLGLLVLPFFALPVSEATPKRSKVIFGDILPWNPPVTCALKNRVEETGEYRTFCSATLAHSKLITAAHCMTQNFNPVLHQKFTEEKVIADCPSQNAEVRLRVKNPVFFSDSSYADDYARLLDRFYPRWEKLYDSTVGGKSYKKSSKTKREKIQAHYERQYEELNSELAEVVSPLDGGYLDFSVETGSFDSLTFARLPSSEAELTTLLKGDCYISGHGRNKDADPQKNVQIEGAGIGIHLTVQALDLENDRHGKITSKSRVNRTGLGDSGGSLLCKDGEAWVLVGIPSTFEEEGFSFFSALGENDLGKWLRKNLPLRSGQNMGKRTDPKTKEPSKIRHPATSPRTLRQKPQ